MITASELSSVSTNVTLFAIRFAQFGSEYISLRFLFLNVACLGIAFVRRVTLPRYIS